MKKPSLHIAFWIVFYVLYTFMTTKEGESLYVVGITNIVNVAQFAITYYILRNIQIPYLFDRKRYILFGLSFILALVSLSTFCRGAALVYIAELNGQVFDPPFYKLSSVIWAARNYIPAFILVALESYYTKSMELQRLQNIEKDKIAHELKFLKAQINPHFLFNTLNNIYSYAVTQSDKAPQMILRLSEMLDYILYKSQKERVDLSLEIDNIQNFIALEQIRYGDRLRVTTDIENKHNPQIAPLILLSTVENAFKHGASGDIDKPKIHVAIQTSMEMIYARIWNTKSQYEGHRTDSYKEAIGLKNIQRQLDIMYPAKHGIEIVEDEDSFGVEIKLYE